MTEFYRDEWLTILQGDVRDVLPTLPADSVDCIVTSPPYWGLRDYGTASWSGGLKTCPHAPSQEWIDHNFNANSAFGATNSTQSAAAIGKWYRSDGSCRCGAIRSDSQIGLERTPAEYVANLVGVFRELRRVLKPSGTCWLNLGDSYAAGKTGRADGERNGVDGFTGGQKFKGEPFQQRPVPHGLKPKDLVGIPWRVAFALQADGWYLRSDIIWSKPNPMPESVTDRPTKSHEYLFLLTKSARYFYDSAAVAEAAIRAGELPGGGYSADVGYPGNGHNHEGFAVNAVTPVKPTRNLRSVWTIATTPYGSIGAGPGDTAGTTSPDCLVHSLPAIRRRLQTGSDDELRDHLRRRSPRTDAGHAPAFADGLFASLDHGSPDQSLSTLDYQNHGSSDAPTLGNTDGDKTPSQLTSGDDLASGEGTDRHTSHSSSPTMLEADAEPFGSGSVAATRRSEHESRTIGESEQPGSEEPEQGRRTPDNAGQNEPVCSCPNNSASHFAVFPPELPERCIKAGSSERGVCPECGAPWERVTEKSRTFESGSGKAGNLPVGKNGVNLQGGGETGDIRRGPVLHVETTGWADPCGNDLTPDPAVVLDPFAGSGTTGMVANRLSRRAILVDLNASYLVQQMKRNAQVPLGLGA